MLTVKLKREPIFDIEKDLEQLRRKLENNGQTVKFKAALFPTSRAYILTRSLEPVAIFDHLGPAFGTLLKLLLTTMGKPIDKDGYEAQILEFIREQTQVESFDKPYIVAVFIADQVFSHFAISPDLMLVICDRLKNLDLVDRWLWEAVFDFDVE